jgi:hypothetical protein
MKWSTMSVRDRRAVVLGAVAIGVPVLFIWGIRPYLGALDDARQALSVEREALAREQAAVASARDNPRMRQVTDSAMQILEPKLFEGRDDVMASSLLASYVGAVAQRSRVWLQDANTRVATQDKDGVRALHVDIRGQSDLRGALRFLQALDRGDKLVRVDKLDVTRAPGTGDDPMETLMVTATLSGFALPGPNAPRDTTKRSPTPAASRAGGTQ